MSKFTIGNRVKITGDAVSFKENRGKIGSITNIKKSNGPDVYIVNLEATNSNINVYECDMTMLRYRK